MTITVTAYDANGLPVSPPLDFPDVKAAHDEINRQLSHLATTTRTIRACDTPGNVVQTWEVDLGMALTHV